MTIRKISAKHTVANALTYIGEAGHLFYDPTDGKLRLSDGITPGGQLIYIEGDVMYWDEDIIPTLDNTFNLGSPERRWKSMHVGPGSLYLYDIVNHVTAELSIDNGILKINGANQLQVGQLKFVDNNIVSDTPSVNISIGYEIDTANIILNRNVKLAASKLFKFDDGPTLSANTSSMLIVDSNFTIGGDNVLIVGDVDGEFNNIVVNGITYNSQAVLSSTGSNFVGQLMLHRHSSSVQPILVSALSNSDDINIDTDIGYGQPIFQIASTAWVGNDYKEFAGIIFKSDDSTGITISNSSSPGRIDFNVTPDGQVGTNTAIAIRNDSRVEFSNGLILNAGNIPSSSKGSIGDLGGMFIVDNNYLYHCSADYDSTTNIWRRIAWPGNTW